VTFRSKAFLAASIFGGLFSATALADPITGVLNITGSVQVGPTSIDFLPLATGTGTVAADAFTNTGSFAVLNTGNTAQPSAGVIKDLSGPPLTGAVNVTSFIDSFSAAPNIRLDLTFVNPGIFSASGCVGTPAVGDTCTPAGSPFNLSNVLSGNAISTVISFGFAGNAINTTTGETDTYTGVLSTQLDGISLQQILAELVVGTPITSSYSGTITVTPAETAVPEPGSSTMVFAGMGMLILSFAFRRIRGKQ
jgi:hypothetical protein